MAKLNDTISAFESFQTWQQIDTLEKAVELAANPVNYFDKIMIAGVNLQSDQRPDPAGVATMFGIDRNGYLRELGSTCQRPGGCKTYPVKPPEAVPPVSWQQYEPYLSFDGRRFQVNSEAIEGAAERFKTYATTPEQLEELNRWEALCNALNEHRVRGLLTGDLYAIASQMGFRTDGSQLYIDTENIVKFIKREGVRHE